MHLKTAQLSLDGFLYIYIFKDLLIKNFFKFLNYILPLYNIMYHEMSVDGEGCTYTAENQISRQDVEVDVEADIHLPTAEF